MAEPVKPLTTKQAERIYLGLTSVELMMLGRQVAAIRDGQHRVITAARLAQLESIERERNEAQPVAWKMVPVELTEEMLGICVDGTPDHLNPYSEKNVRAIWAALLDLAPPPPAQFTVEQVREAWERQYVSPLTPAAPTFSEERTLAWNNWLACARHYGLIRPEIEQL
jgi:hypothetical protein